MTHQNALRFDPIIKASAMLNELGKDAAVAMALENIQKAHDEGENYTLSLWREVRRELKTEVSS